MGSKRTMDRLLLPRLREEPLGVERLIPESSSPLPLWQTVPMDAKFPVAKAPKGQLTFVTTKMCEPEYKSKQKKDFDLADPYNYTTKTEYKPLCDPHLKGWFAKPSIRKQLLEKELITKDGRVTCNVQDFNDYRYFLRRQASMKIDLSKKHTAAQERRKVQLQQAKMRAELFSVEVKYKALKVKEKNKKEEEMKRKLLEEKVAKEEVREEKRMKEEAEKVFEKIRKDMVKRRGQKLVLKKLEEQSKMKSLGQLRKFEEKSQQTLDKIDYLREQRLFEMDQKRKEQWKKKREFQERVLEELRKQQERVEAIRRVHTRRYDEELAKKEIVASATAPGGKPKQKDKKQDRDRKKKDKAAAFAKRMAMALQDTNKRTIQEPPTESLERTCSMWILDDLLHRLGLGDKTLHSGDEGYSMATAEALDSALDMAVKKLVQTYAISSDQDLLSQIIHHIVRKIKEAHPGKVLQEGITKEADQDPSPDERARLFHNVDDTEETEKAVRITMCATMDLDKNWDEPVKLGADFPPSNKTEEEKEMSALHEQFFQTSMRLSESDAVAVEKQLKNFLSSLESQSFGQEEHAAILQTCLKLICHEPIVVDMKNMDLERNPEGKQVFLFQPDLDDQTRTKEEEVGAPGDKEPTLEQPEEPNLEEPEEPILEQPKEPNAGTEEPKTEEEAKEKEEKDTTENALANKSQNHKGSLKKRAKKAKSGKSKHRGHNSKLGLSSNARVGDKSHNADEVEKKVSSDAASSKRKSDASDITADSEADDKEDQDLSMDLIEKYSEEEDNDQVFEKALEIGDMVAATQSLLKKIQNRNKLEGVYMAPPRLLHYLAMSLSKIWKRNPEDDDHEIGDWILKPAVHDIVNSLVINIKSARFSDDALRKLAIGLTSAVMADIGVPENQITDGVVRTVLKQFLSDLQADNVKLSILESALHNVVDAFDEALREDVDLKVHLFLIDILSMTEEKLKSGEIATERDIRESITNYSKFSEKEKEHFIMNSWVQLMHETKVLLQLRLLNAQDKKKIANVVTDCANIALEQDVNDLDGDPAEAIDRINSRRDDKDLMTKVCLLMSANIVNKLKKHQDLCRITSMTLFPGALNLSQSAYTGTNVTNLGNTTIGEAVAFLLMDKLARDLGENTLSNFMKSGMANSIRELMVASYGYTKGELEGDALWNEVNNLTLQLAYDVNGLRDSLKVLGAFLKPCLVEVIGSAEGKPATEELSVDGSNALIKLATQAYVSLIRAILDRLHCLGLCLTDTVDTQVVLVWKAMSSLAQEARSVLVDLKVERRNKKLLNRVRKSDSLLLQGFLQTAEPTGEGEEPNIKKKPDPVGLFLSSLLNRLQDPGYIPLPEYQYEADVDDSEMDSTGTKESEHTTDSDAEFIKPTKKRQAGPLSRVELALRRELIKEVSNLTKSLISEQAMVAMATNMADNVASTAFVLDDIVATCHDKLWLLKVKLHHKRLQPDKMLDFLLKQHSEEVKPASMTSDQAEKLAKKLALQLEKLQNLVRTVAKMVESLSRMVQSVEDSEHYKQPFHILGAVSPVTLTHFSRVVLLELCQVMTSLITGEDNSKYEAPIKEKLTQEETKILLTAYTLIRNELSALRNKVEKEKNAEDETWTPSNVAGSGEPSALKLPMEVLDYVFGKLSGVMEGFKENAGSASEEALLEDLKFEGDCEKGPCAAELTNALINEVISNVAYRVDIGQFPFTRVTDLVNKQPKISTLQSKISSALSLAKANISENKSVDPDNKSWMAPKENLECDVSNLLFMQLLEMLNAGIDLLKNKTNSCLKVDECFNAMVRAKSFLQDVTMLVREELAGKAKILVTDQSKALSDHSHSDDHHNKIEGLNYSVEKNISDERGQISTMYSIGKSATLASCSTVQGTTITSCSVGKAATLALCSIEKRARDKEGLAHYILSTFQSFMDDTCGTTQERKNVLDVLRATFSVLSLQLLTPQPGKKQLDKKKKEAYSRKTDLSLLIIQMIKHVINELPEERPETSCFKEQTKIIQMQKKRKQKSANPYAIDIMERGKTIESLLKKKSSLNRARHSISKHVFKLLEKHKPTPPPPPVPMRATSPPKPEKKKQQSCKRVFKWRRLVHHPIITNRLQTKQSVSSGSIGLQGTGESASEFSSLTSASQENKSTPSQYYWPIFSPMKPRASPISDYESPMDISAQSRRESLRGFFFDRPMPPKSPLYSKTFRGTIQKPLLKSDSASNTDIKDMPPDAVSSLQDNISKMVSKPALIEEDETEATAPATADEGEANVKESLYNPDESSVQDKNLRSSLVTLLATELPEEAEILTACLDNLDDKEQAELDIVAFLTTLDSLKEKLILENCDTLSARDLLQWVDETPVVSQRTAGAINNLLRVIETTGMKGLGDIGVLAKTEVEKHKTEEKLHSLFMKFAEKAEESHPVPAIIFSVADIIVDHLRKPQPALAKEDEEEGFSKSCSSSRSSVESNSGSSGEQQSDAINDGENNYENSNDKNKNTRSGSSEERDSTDEENNDGRRKVLKGSSDDHSDDEGSDGNQKTELYGDRKSDLESENDNSVNDGITAARSSPCLRSTRSKSSSRSSSWSGEDMGEIAGSLSSKFKGQSSCSQENNKNVDGVEGDERNQRVNSVGDAHPVEGGDKQGEQCQGQNDSEGDSSASEM